MPSTHLKYCLRFLSAILAFFTSFLPLPTYAAKKTIVCSNTYALCSSAPCRLIPKVKNKVLCTCTIWKGKNIGYSNCKKRIPVVTAKGKIKLLSTFGFGNKQRRINICPKITPWAWCMDRPCIRDKTNPQQAFCTCTIKRNSAYITFATHCHQKYCSKSIWSGAPVSSANQKMFDQLANRMGYKKTPVRYCRAFYRTKTK